MIRRLLLHLVQSRLDRGQQPGPRLDRWLNARPDARRRADALLDADRQLRAAGAAMRDGEELALVEPPVEQDAVIGRLGLRRQPIAIAALLALAVSLLTYYAFLGPDSGNTPGTQERLVVSPDPPAPPSPIGLANTASGEGVAAVQLEELTGLTRVADRVAAGLGRLDTLDASAVRSASDAIAATYRAEADGVAATLAALLPNVQLAPATGVDDPAG